MPSNSGRFAFKTAANKKRRDTWPHSLSLKNRRRRAVEPVCAECAVALGIHVAAVRHTVQKSAHFIASGRDMIITPTT